MLTTTFKLKHGGKPAKTSQLPPPNTYSKKKRSSKHKTEGTALTACVVECGHDHHSQGEEHKAQPPVHTPMVSLPTTNITPAQKELNRILEAGLMINGLKVLFMSLAEKIELHVNHNAITPELLQELDDVAQAALITTKKLRTLRAPCCDLYTITASPGEECEGGEEE